MKYKRLFKGIGSIGLCVFLLIGFMPNFANAQKSKHPIPPVVKLGTHEVGTGGFMLAGIAAESIIEKYGNKIRSIPNGVEFSRSRVGQLGTVDLIFHSSVQYYPLAEGLFGYDTSEWGPQPIRLIFTGEHVGMGIAVRGDSDIKTMADLKGKKFAYFPGGPGTTWRTGAQLAFAKLTYNDVVAVPFPSPPRAYSALIDGKIDATYMNVDASKAFEAISMPAGLRWLGLPFNDEEGWKRLWDKCPIAIQRLADVGAGISDKNPLECVGQLYPAFIAWPNADKDVIYFMTKAFREAFPIMAAKSKAIARLWKPEDFWKRWEHFSSTIPIHEAALEYYKEIGEWNSEREKIQQERLKHQADLKKLWDETLIEVGEKNLKQQDFSGYWLKKRAEAGFYVPDPLPK